MALIGQLPSDYASWLTAPGLAGPSADDAALVDSVALRNYLCAVDEYGGNKSALELQVAVLKVARQSNDIAWIAQMPKGEFDRIFSGQGHPSRVREVWSFIWRHRADFVAYKVGQVAPFAAYFENATAAQAMQAMVDDKRFGLDCIGFVGRYLESERVAKQFPAMYPRNYLDWFKPIDNMAALDALCVLVWVNGSHIALVDSVDSRSGDTATVTVSQSSKGGPQTNSRVILQRANGVDFIDFGGYGKELGNRNLSEAEKDKLRKKHTVKGANTGYRGGIFLKIAHVGQPAMPVTGHVYAGKLQAFQFLKAWL